MIPSASTPTAGEASRHTGGHHHGLVLLAAILLMLVHWPERVMACTYPHRCWVAIVPVFGVAAHQRWDAVRRAGGRAELSLADERSPAVREAAWRRDHGGSAGKAAA